jgi:hypothetical protein
MSQLIFARCSGSKPSENLPKFSETHWKIFHAGRATKFHTGERTYDVETGDFSQQLAAQLLHRELWLPNVGGAASLESKDQFRFPLEKDKLLKIKERRMHLCHKIWPKLLR